MKILGIDTTTSRLCLGLYVDGKFYEYSLQVGRRLSELLVPVIQRVICALGLKIADFDYFACGLGPGSFTGMRIGLATIKGLSVVSNKPVVGISTLDILAMNAPVKDRLIVTALDAKRSLIYCSAYRYERGSLKRKSAYALLSLEELVKKFPHKAVILGDAAALYGDALLTRIKNAAILDKDYWIVQAHNLMSLALAKIKAKQFSSVLTVKPIYLYSKECQIKTR
ncbi:MAG: tRNA (adenosine(37)-N6)-threonylcarbamoyltransferase complex dimerization subunit type 1 TsaB [Candidatus Omnitrophota bacterium]|nr:tRNA (adenosine(37)-N6)-threonylcarbamoyltransferase complex dimerization subunit type 1 TsaB [Candidatus Omnitrophota bacterium]